MACALFFFFPGVMRLSFEFRLARTPASPLIAVILLGVLSAGSAGSQPSEIDPLGREGIPDLNRLQKRVLEFWSLVTRGQKYQALSYVAEGQDHFLNWKWPPVESYRVANLELEEGSHEVVVMVQAVVRPPGFGNPVNWPVRQRWVFRKDTWQILVEGSKLAALFGGTRPRPADSSLDQTETLQEFRRFRIGKRRIHFGQVLQGEVIWDEIPYKNESAIEIGVRVSEAPSWIALDRSHFVIEPGGEGALLLGVFTEKLEGDIKGALTLELGHGGTSRTQTIPVLGSVRVPLSIVPGRLVLVPGASHEILLRNDTQETVRIAEIRMPAVFLVSEWAAGSAQIGPGSHSILKVRWAAAQTSEGWSGGVIRLRLAQPVGGQTEVTIPVLRRFP